MSFDSEIQLKDCISGQTVSLNEWIKHELLRIQNNIEPRHCHSYSELVQVIEEPFRFQVNKASKSSHDDCSAPLSHLSDNPTFISSCAAQLHSLENIRKSLMGDNRRQLTSTHLCHAFLKLLPYDNHAQSPRQLLHEFDKLRLNMKQQRPVDPFVFKEKLMSILFGKIQLTEQLVKPWQLICEWITAATESCDEKIAHQWIQLVGSIFIIAKRLYHRKYRFICKDSYVPID